MRYRKLSADGDYVFGAGGLDYTQNTPETVAAAIVSRLRLLVGEWFLDVSAGTDWQTKILGANTQSSRDMTIYAAVLNTQGVKRIVSYGSTIDSQTRKFSVSIVVDTIYGVAALASEVN